MISLRKINALLSKQMKTVAYNPFILVGLLVAPFMALFLGSDGPEGTLLSFLVQINVLFAGANTMCILITEEKEKHTLNVLRTSTVSGLDILISNVVFTTIVAVAINALIYIILGFNQELLPFGEYLLITGVGIMPAAAIGALIGIICKNQMTASTTIVPIMVLLINIPLFMSGSFFVNEIMYFAFTEQMLFGLEALHGGESILSNIGIIAANFAVLAIVFAILYRKRGFAS